jgi:hypothetical protein
MMGCIYGFFSPKLIKILVFAVDLCILRDAGLSYQTIIAYNR